MKIRATALGFCLDMVSLPIFLPVLGTNQTETVAARGPEGSWPQKDERKDTAAFSWSRPSMAPVWMWMYVGEEAMVAHGANVCLSVTDL